MKKLNVFLALLLVAAMLVACGTTPDPTEPPTQPTQAPTEPPTEPPTDPPTEPPTEPMEPITGYYLDEPDGFTAAAATDLLSIIAGPDADGTSITIMKLEIPLDLSEVTEENFADSLGIANEEQDLVLNAMETVEVDGYPAMMLDYNMTTSGIDVHCIGYFITDGNLTYTFIFTDATADGAWADEYAASIASLNMLVEGEVIPVSTEGLEEYDLACGLTIYAAPGLQQAEIEEMAACLESTDLAIMVYEYDKVQYGLYGVALKDFASMLVDGELVTAFEQDPYGNIAAAYQTNGSDGNLYFYYDVCFNTPDSFWLIECACDADAAAVYLDSFAQWCATLTETK